jgi:hypothetical protein
MVIGYDGGVGLCCEDSHLEVQLGSATNASLQSIYENSVTLSAYRSAHAEGRLDGLALCRDCHSWAGDAILDREVMSIHGKSVEKTVTPACETYKSLE